MSRKAGVDRKARKKVARGYVAGRVTDRELGVEPGVSRKNLQEQARWVVSIFQGVSEEERPALFPKAIERLKETDILSATVPRRCGGKESSPSEITAALSVLASADGSLAQVPQSHFVFSRWLFNGEHENREALWAERILTGGLIANAQADSDIPVVLYERENKGRYFSGKKIFCTGSLYADYLAITVRDRGHLSGEGLPDWGIFIEAQREGVQINDDWESIGQQLTGSGSILFRDVQVFSKEIYDYQKALALPGYGAFAQLLHAAIDVGLAEGAVLAALAAVEADTVDDLSASLAGSIIADQYALRATLEKAAEEVDRLWNVTSDVGSTENGSRGSESSGKEKQYEVALNMAAAKTFISQKAVEITSRVYELVGTRGTHPSTGFDRYCRDVRTHTLHEKRRNKNADIGRAWITGQAPSLGPQL